MSKQGIKPCPYSSSWPSTKANAAGVNQQLRIGAYAEIKKMMINIYISSFGGAQIDNRTNEISMLKFGTFSKWAWKQAVSIAGAIQVNSHIMTKCEQSISSVKNLHEQRNKLYAGGWKSEEAASEAWSYRAPEVSVLLIGMALSDKFKSSGDRSNAEKLTQHNQRT